MSDTSLAFLPLEARAAARAGAEPLDRISVRDFIREVEIGAFQEERGTLQKLRFNVVIEVAPHDAAVDDDVDKILSYDEIIEAIDDQLAFERLKLLETLAERIADQCLLNPKARRAYVRIEKLDRIPGALGVEISRSRKDGEVAELPVAPATKQDAAQPPLVLALSPDATPHCDAWLEALSALEGPALVVFLPEPELDHSALANRRINLLEADKLAWVHARPDAGLEVADSRTEAEYRLRHGGKCVLAPSKLVWDSAHPPVTGAETTAQLASWLAAEFASEQAVFAGDPIDIPGVRGLPATGWKTL